MQKRTRKFIRFLLIFIIVIGNHQLFAQNYKEDSKLVVDMTEVQHNYSKSRKKIIKVEKKNIVSKVNPVNNILRVSLWVYQNAISDQLAGHCPYEVSCSNFSKEAIQEFGFLKGVFFISR